MVRRFLMRNWTDEERLAYRKWARGMAFFYGLAVFLLLGVIAMNKPLNMAATGAKDLTAAKSDVQIMGRNGSRTMARKESR